MKKYSGILYKVIRYLCVWILCFTLSSCTYKDRVAPISLPDSESGVVAGDGLKISAVAFYDPKKAQEAFGFDARKAGLLPVQLTFQNDGTKEARVDPEQTFLIDQENNAWPVSSLERTFQRTKGHVDVGETMAGTAKPALLLGMAGAIAGAAVGIVTGENVGSAMGKGAAVGGAVGAGIGGVKSYTEAQKQIKDDLAEKSLKNAPILPGQIAYGVLFFPGIQGEEAQGVKELRLSLSFGQTKEIVKIKF